MKKSLLLIKALIIVFFSAQVSLAEDYEWISASLAEKVFKNGEYRKTSNGMDLFYYRNEFYTCYSYTDEGVYELTDGINIGCERIPVKFIQ